MPHRTALLTGTAFALAAGLMWGTVFVLPLLLPGYPAALQSFGRYLAFGLIALPLAWLDRERLRQLTAADWLEALKLAMVGNIVYYLFLAASIQHAGAPLPTMIVGTLPVVIAISSNLRDGWRGQRLPWSRLAWPLALLLAGILFVNHAEWQRLRATAQGAPSGLWTGAALAVGAVACWTWYPIRNADWLQAHAGRSSSTWATAQGIATLPLAVFGYGGWCALHALGGVGPADFALPLGPTPARFVLAMFAVGLMASWLGTLCWNQASQRLPTALVGALIVFETLAALAYAFMLRREAPGATTLLGVALLVAGVLWALRNTPRSGTPSASTATAPPPPG